MVFVKLNGQVMSLFIVNGQIDYLLCIIVNVIEGITLIFFFWHVGSLLLRAGFLQLWRARAYSSLWCTGFSLVVASLVAEHGPQSTRASVVVVRRLSSCGVQALERRLSSCGAWAQLLHGMWDLPGPGMEPVSPALAGGFLTTEPPGKPSPFSFIQLSIKGLLLSQRGLCISRI